MRYLFRDYFHHYFHSIQRKMKNHNGWMNWILTTWVYLRYSVTQSLAFTFDYKSISILSYIVLFFPNWGFSMFQANDMKMSFNDYWFSMESIRVVFYKNSIVTFFLILWYGRTFLFELPWLNIRYLENHLHDVEKVKFTLTWKIFRENISY